MSRSKVKDREFFGTWVDASGKRQSLKLETANPATIEDLEFIRDVLNKTKGAEETSDALAKLVTEWKKSGPNLAKMMAANLPLWRTLAGSCNATWTVTKTGGASIHLAPGIAPPKFGHGSTSAEKAEADAVILFYLLTLGPWEKLGGPCPRCKKYFVRKRANHKIYCGRRCSSLASAAVSTRRKLDEVRNDKIERARKAIQEWDALKGRPAIGWKRWVHKRVPDITSKWLTRAVNDHEKYKLGPPKKEGRHATRKD